MLTQLKNLMTDIPKAIEEIKALNASASSDPADLIMYSLDATKVKHKPDVVVFPQSTKEVSDLIKICAKYKLPVTPRGAGTGFAGGSVPIKGGVALVMTKMNRLLNLNKDALYVEVEPGIVNGELGAYLAKENLFYPPDPASLKSSTIGGNVATGAGGPRAVKYGVTGDYVMGLTVVLANGEVLKTGIKTEKGVVGYDLKKLFVGSEGTLGVITEIRLKVVPLPPAVITATAVFEKRDDAVNAVTKILGAGLRPRTLEYIDRTAIECVEKFIKAGLPANADAMLLVETDGRQEDAIKEMQAISEICKNAESFEIASGVKEAEAQWKTRRSISASLQRLRPKKLNEDITVPRNKISKLMERVDELSKRVGLPIICFGHAGDGNIHVNVMHNDNDKESETALKAVDEIFDITIELDGTISGEHGVGLAKMPYIGKELGKTAIDISKALKKTLDPDNILNPGKLFPST